MDTLSLDQAQARDWDVIVIGAGLGGGVAGRRLAEAGLSVLFVEKGAAGYPTEENGTGNRAKSPEARLLRGLWPKMVEAHVDGSTQHFFAPIGSGAGGSSVFYAAALERPEPHDLDDLPGLPHPAGGWPVGFDAFGPWFDEAARIMHLCGTDDPLSEAAPLPLNAPPPARATDTATLEDLRALGLHPYRLNLALKYPATCQSCFGHKCPRDCKMDGRSAGVRPALATGRAGLLTYADVQKIQTTDGRVTGVRVRKGGDEADLSASVYILAAGALGSPRLLLASDVANSSGWVGRGLMFHLNEMFALWPGSRMPEGETPSKSVALRDIYTKDSARFGMVQSMGLEASYGNIYHHLTQVFDRSPLRRIRTLRDLLRIPAAIAARVFGNAGIYVGFIEDFPLPENRVVLNPTDPEVLTFEYRYTPELLARRTAFRRAIKAVLKGRRMFFLSQSPALNYGHPSGTLRFGTDPATSVLNPDCRSHDLDNLYVADASFMRSSLGVNPSLTIVANALRVADIIAKRQTCAEAA